MTELQKEYGPEYDPEVENVEITEDMLKYGNSAKHVERMKVVSEDFGNSEVHAFTMDHCVIIFGLAIVMMNMELPMVFPAVFAIYGIIQFFHSQRNSIVMRKIRGE